MNPLRDRAVALRLDNDMSIRAIAAAVGAPRSTVGGWLKGVGETRQFGTCKLCGERFTAASGKRRFCGVACAAKARGAFGGGFGL